MAVFEYVALNSKGKKIKGVVDADSSRGARNKLKQQGIFPTSLVETGDQQQKSSRAVQLNSGGRKVSGQHLAIATRQLATLVSAGIPLVEAIKALGEQIDHQRLKRVFAEVCDRVNEGSTFANALRDHPKVFPKLYVNMIASGEASGSLELVLERLADLLEAQADLRRKVVGAAVYPVLMLFLCLGVVVLLLTVVIPQITAIFEDQKKILPLPTRVIVAMSNFLRDEWYWLIAIIAAVTLLFIRYKRSEKGRKQLDRIRLKLPMIGSLNLKIATARLARTLGTLLASGVEVLTALGIVKNIIGNVVLEEALEEASLGVKEGKGLAAELNKSGHFPRLLVHMVSVGEKTGQLEQMLLRAAQSYESEVNAVIAALTRVLEPALILFLALIVGGILAAVMLPMLEISSLAG